VNKLSAASKLLESAFHGADRPGKTGSRDAFYTQLVTRFPQTVKAVAEHPKVFDTVVAKVQRAQDRVTRGKVFIQRCALTMIRHHLTRSAVRGGCVGSVARLRLSPRSAR